MRSSFLRCSSMGPITQKRSTTSSGDEIGVSLATSHVVEIVVLAAVFYEKRSAQGATPRLVFGDESIT